MYQYTVLPSGMNIDAAERQRKLARIYRLLINLARKRRDLVQMDTDETSQKPNQQMEPT